MFTLSTTLESHEGLCCKLTSTLTKKSSDPDPVAVAEEEVYDDFLPPGVWETERESLALDKEIGHGNFGIVWKGKQTNTSHLLRAHNSCTHIHKFTLLLLLLRFRFGKTYKLKKIKELYIFWIFTGYHENPCQRISPFCPGYATLNVKIACFSLKFEKSSKKC